MEAIRKKVTHPVFIMPFLLAFTFIVLNAYLIKQGAYIFAYSLSANKIDALLSGNTLGPKERDFLERVSDIKKFAVGDLGLANNENYSTYLTLNKGYLVDVVSACRKDTFEQYIWQYPVFGGFPYKGFFERKDAEAEAAALKKKNLDVIIRKVDAFSTLGFTKDPVYDFMSEYSEYELASTIIHEQTHATIFLANEVQFNEELAVFVGQEGALRYVREKHGATSKEYKEAADAIIESGAFTDFIRKLYRTLEGIYALNVSESIKLQARGIVMFQNREHARLDSIRARGGKGAGESARFPLNNAFIMLYMGYEEDLTPFYDLYKSFGNDLQKTIRYIVGLKTSNQKPMEYLKNGIGKS